MHEDSSWDFRESQELAASREYNKEGFIIRKADLKYLELIKNDIERIYFEFSGISTKKNKSLKNAHWCIQHENCNDLRLHIMNKINQGTSFPGTCAAKNIIPYVAELAMQKGPDSR